MASRTADRLGYVRGQTTVSYGEVCDIVEEAAADARAIAERIVVDARDLWVAYHQSGSVRDHWGTPNTGGPLPIDTCQDALCVATRDDLAAYEAAVEPTP